MKHYEKQKYNRKWKSDASTFIFIYLLLREKGWWHWRENLFKLTTPSIFLIKWINLQFIRRKTLYKHTKKTRRQGKKNNAARDRTQDKGNHQGWNAPLNKKTENKREDKATKEAKSIIWYPWPSWADKGSGSLLSNRWGRSTNVVFYSSAQKIKGTLK